MTDITHLIQSGSAQVWLYLPVAVALGALHGLEPGHSKTMMAAFIIAIRGTVWQAALLGLSAAISHSLLIWLLAALALKYGGNWTAEHTEPFFHLASAALVLALAAWMFVRTRRELAEFRAHDHHGEHDHGHSHGHGPSAAGPSPHGGILLDTGHGWLDIGIFETDVPPRFRVYPCKANGQPVPLPKGTQLTIETARSDGSLQKFEFAPKATHWEATSELPEPHEFLATVTLGHADHAHTYRVRFTEDHHHHDHLMGANDTAHQEDAEYQDAHERAHAEAIAKRFANRSVTTPQIVLFGITGGLMPCPAAFTILLVCLQIKKAVLGFSLVAAFSFGLALTMVIVGVIAAWSVQHANRKIRGFSEWMRRAPYLSCLILVILAALMAWQGWQGLHGHGGHAH